ncbi:transferase [Streptomyces sp. DH24]|uniref:transferase n=1 Tax=Streptomyces sp. DH24 TaxID=3040123 RepID=UPI0024426342|nr:transferase [Streptomyces sp. DH24]MDG9715416.1 transferase [Streptomyces sp. DH24]
MNGASAASSETPPRVDCTIDADGRITFVLRPWPAAGTAGALPSPHLLLRLRPAQGQPEKTLLTVGLAPADDGRLRGVLDPRPALAEGRWDVYLLPHAAAERLRLRPGLRDQRALVGGHTRDWPSPVAVRVPYTTVDGYLAVRAWLRTAHAEVEGIDAAGRSLTVRARLHGTPLSGAATVRLRRRDGAGAVRSLRPRAESGGPRFSFTVDYEELVADSGTGSRVWDVFVQPGQAEGAPLVRVGRLLDDVADRKEVFVYPAGTVGGADVRPYYTVDNDLSVQVRPAAGR